ncbi:CHAT domain-containing protein [Calothrix sp. CCY 0018]|uniref:CHAT domain-containing protein n=1 Tax=Calothrix sp. CCY 0018 TaxID=3103864 RepID=UPI0039C5EF0A
MSENSKYQNQFNFHGNIGNLNAGDTTIKGDQIGIQHNTPSKKSLNESTNETSTQPQKILILAATPHNLRLDKEIRSIEECIQRAVRRDLFKVEIKTAVRSQDIRRAIAEEKPQIVHFCGHGLEDGSLLLEDDGGNEKPVSSSGLAALFQMHADYVKCVVLNACHSIKAAEAICQYINYAVGMNQPIQDTSAIEFAEGFYDGLGYDSEKQDMFQRAFQEGLVALKLDIKLDNISQAEIPVMKTKY